MNSTHLLWNGNKVNVVIGKGRQRKGGLPPTLAGKRDHHIRVVTLLQVTVQHILAVGGVAAKVNNLTMQI